MEKGRKCGRRDPGLLTDMYVEYVSGPTSPMRGVAAVLANASMASAVKAAPSNVSRPSSKDLYRAMPGGDTPSCLASAASLEAPKRYESRSDSATALKVVLEAASPAARNATSTTLSAVLNSSSVAAVTVDTAGSACLVMYETILLRARSD